MIKDRLQIYAAQPYRDLLAQNSMTPSMSRKSGHWDNTVAGSFSATLEFELIRLRVFTTKDIATSATFGFIDVLYHRQGTHQNRDHRTPLEVDLQFLFLLN
ncbi:MAG: hypothetical protein KUG52_02735 [Immundisolibacteraceae bacterium]|nr:hypothetical protein [Immundisolibacteraceae bacterium]